MTVAPHFEHSRVFAKDNIGVSASVRGIGAAVAGLGLLLTGIAVVMGFAGDVTAKSVTLHALQVGGISVLGMSLGALGFSMILHAVNAGWWVLLRRQFENVFSLFWVGCLFVVGVLVLQFVFVNMGGAAAEGAHDAVHHATPYLWHWMDPHHTAGDMLYEHKSPFLNVPFFLARMVLYMAVWAGIVAFFIGQGRRQEETGDAMATLRMGRASCIGLLLFAVTTAFAAYDWLMALDYHWFSTMYGVWFFAANTVSSLSLIALILIVLRTFGRAQGAFTSEHMHDMGKLVFGFTVFWGYITFSQYFLIWYANIPEETMWFNIRRADWTWLSWALPICHFIVPFLVMLPAPSRRNSLVFGFICVWIIVWHLFDIFWNVRPQIRSVNHITPIDVLGVMGPVFVFVGLLIKRIASRPLIPRNDPRMDEALSHKNYV